MITYPYLSETAQSRISTDSFYGYNNKLRVSDGEWNYTHNITGDHFPLFANRHKRGIVSEFAAPQGIVAKDALAVVDNGKLYYNGYEIEGFGLAADGVKQLVSMGAYLVIFPDKVYLNTQDLTEFGSLEQKFETTGESQLIMCDINGNDYATPVTSTSAPNNPSNKALWLDISETPSSLKQYSEDTEAWITIPTVYTKISSADIGKAFEVYDGVQISGITHAEDETESVSEQLDALNGSKIIYAKDNDYIVVVGLLDHTYTIESTITVHRKCPDMDYVCEAGNRLWGCKYGLVDGEPVNELYCCVLGDFKNWEQYLGLSTDSWRASVGSDGQFTGAINHLGYPTFFKENIMHRIAVSSSGAHGVSDVVCRGVQKGSWRSLQIVNEVLYYKSRSDVCAFDGSLPVSVSEALGEEKYYDAVAGVFGQKYYISMKNAAGQYSLFLYDVQRGLWLREDELEAIMFCAQDDELFCIDASTKQLLAMNGTQGTPEESVPWEAVSGIMYYETPDHKYLSRYNIRLQMKQGASLEIAFKYDGDSGWESGGAVKFTGHKTFTLPVRPRRCDHLQMRLKGTGDVRIFSITRIFEQGSDE